MVKSLNVTDPTALRATVSDGIVQTHTYNVHMTALSNDKESAATTPISVTVSKCEEPRRCSLSSSLSLLLCPCSYCSSPALHSFSSQQEPLADEQTALIASDHGVLVAGRGGYRPKGFAAINLSSQTSQTDPMRERTRAWQGFRQVSNLCHRVRSESVLEKFRPKEDPTRSVSFLLSGHGCASSDQAVVASVCFCAQCRVLRRTSPPPSSTSRM